MPLRSAFTHITVFVMLTESYGKMQLFPKKVLLAGRAVSVKAQEVNGYFLTPLSSVNDVSFPENVITV